MTPLPAGRQGLETDYIDRNFVKISKIPFYRRVSVSSYYETYVTKSKSLPADRHGCNQGALIIFLELSKKGD